MWFVGRLMSVLALHYCELGGPRTTLWHGSDGSRCTKGHPWYGTHQAGEAQSREGTHSVAYVDPPQVVMRHEFFTA